MQIENETFEHRLSKPLSWEEHVFRFCEFRDIDGQGLHITSEFIDCEFDDGDFYWALFNGIALVGVTFRNCRFRGCSFSGCRVVECSFEHCEFTQDNLGGDCTFRGSRWYACKQSATRGLSGEMALDIASG
ncbi:pentapeptide repeat-containing protein [Dyella acidisoli]|uniref:pentapeptide repeat-containing protein n=1 Tax=Dyella acidisoli TaxID=1867834 RepID=UPI003C2EFCF7